MMFHNTESFNRRRRIAPMKFTVDMKKCQDHGQCVYSAPTLFALDDLAS